jgi:hypothetical protein
MKQFLKGRVEVSVEEQLEALQEAVKQDKALLSKAVDLMLKSKGYVPGKIVHQNGRVFADVTLGESLPEFPSSPSTGPMASGWKRKFVGLTGEIRQYLDSWKKRGRKEIDFDTLYGDMMKIYREKLPRNKRSEFEPLDQLKFAGYLHDKRYLPGIRYNSVKKVVTFI